MARDLLIFKTRLPYLAISSFEKTGFPLHYEIPSIPYIDNSMAGIAGAGADINISKHLVIRSQADYLATHHFSILEKNHRFSFGVVVRL